jgi:hypothetical protein
MKFHRPTPAMIVALLALVLALSGSAVAASLITSKQIKDGTIQTRDLSKKAVKALQSGRGLAGAQGIAGPQGQKGDKGDAGEKGQTGERGEKGARGETGPTGPTAGAVSAGVTPPAAGGCCAASTITTTTAGKIIATLSIRNFSLNCGGQACSVTYGLYIDGQPIPGAGVTRSLSAGQSATYNDVVFGAAADVPAGTHTITFDWGSTGGGSAGGGSAQTSAIAVGS